MHRGHMPLSVLARFVRGARLCPLTEARQFDILTINGQRLERSIAKGRKKCRTILPDLASVRRSATRDFDLCDLYAFQSPSDPSRTVIILNANPNADALHPDAIYRLNIDNDDDLLTDVALSYVFSRPQNGKQTFNVFLAKGAELRSVEAIGRK